MGTGIGYRLAFRSKLPILPSGADSFWPVLVFFCFIMPKLGEKDPDSDDFCFIGYTEDPDLSPLPTLYISFSIFMWIFLAFFFLTFDLCWSSMMIGTLS